jgi:hypothetical protein
MSTSNTPGHPVVRIHSASLSANRSSVNCSLQHYKHLNHDSKNNYYSQNKLHHISHHIDLYHPGQLVG